MSIIKGEVTMSHENCIFCKIIKGDIPSYTVCEDDDFKVFMDIAPATKGHMLVVPKQHYADIYEIEPDVLGKAAKMAQKVIKHATKVLGCDGYNLVQNNGEIAGQTVFHFHMHLIPRYENMNNAGLVSVVPGSMESDELKALYEELKMN